MISLFGYGKTNKALSKILAPCNIYDDTFTIKSKDKFNNNLLPSSSFDPRDSVLEIVSPGIPPYSNLVKMARNLVSEYDFIYSNKTPFSIWVSGTNGKTTTTQMMELLLKTHGGFSGGNIGTPLCEINKDARIWVLETSSFTLHYTNKAYPNIYALLPITNDHISWHRNFKHYLDAKLKPLCLMDKDSSAVIPSDFKHTREVKEYKGSLYLYRDASSLAKTFNIDIDKLYFKGAFLLDSILALGVGKILTNTVNYELINSFIIGEHRLEEILDSKGRLFINDSKATNIDATLKAVEAYKDRAINLILGGDSKGISLEPLITQLKTYDIKVFAIGRSARDIADLCSKNNIPFLESKTLESAMDSITRVLNHDNICMLSPACASLDQFTSYKDRGEVFKTYIKKI